MTQMSIGQKKDLEKKVIAQVKLGKKVDIPEALLYSEIFWYKLLQVDPWYFNIMPRKLQQEKKYALLVITKKNSYENLLKLFDEYPHYLRDEQIIAKLFKVQRATSFVTIMSKDIIGNPEFVKRYIRYDVFRELYDRKNDKIVANKDIVLEGIKWHGASFYSYIPEELKHDVAVATMLITKYPWAYVRLPKDVKEIEEISEFALKYDGALLLHCPESIRNNPYFIELAFSHVKNIETMRDVIWNIDDEKMAREKFVKVYREIKRKKNW